MVIRFYLTTLSILIRLRHRKVQALALFNIKRIVLCLLRFYLSTLTILIRLRYRKVPYLTWFNRPRYSVMSAKVLITILSIHFRLRYRNATAIAVCNIQGILLCLLRFYRNI